MSSASMPRKVGQLLPWLPLLVPIAGAILIIWSMIVTLTTTYVNATYPYFGTGPTESHPLAVPVFPANQNGLPKSDLPLLFIGINSIDLVSRSVSVRLDLEIPNAIVTRLRMVTGTPPVPVPLTAVPRRLWAQIPLKIAVGPCGIGSTPADFAATVQNCGGPTVTVPLGQVVNFAGRSSLLDRLISIPAYGAPILFPSDRYTVPTSPVVLLESPVFLDTGQENHLYDKYFLPPVVIIGTTSDVVNYYAITELDIAKAQPMLIGVAISRPIVTELTVYFTAILPLLLALVLVLVWTGRAGPNKRPAFDVSFAAGLIAAMLAILPLRAVLVPSDLGYDSLTFVDYILLLAVMFIAGFMFWQYARFATKSSQEAIKGGEEGETGAESDAKARMKP